MRGGLICRRHKGIDLKRKQRGPEKLIEKKKKKVLTVTGIKPKMAWIILRRQRSQVSIKAHPMNAKSADELQFGQGVSKVEWKGEVSITSKPCMRNEKGGAGHAMT
ncbi:hypothetical protein CEXT_448371 [Caerostris extrusa]|uniref:Uncharacterized protein n=1 Tax=Caerostris extrusa TaxID=172846 RepID=A0AAV4NGS8_CAEEX|nr:hypothetical protein CEXT_448371 [Caerostris extrusa]